MSTETVSSDRPEVADEVFDAAPKAAEVALVGPIERTLTSVKTFVESAKSTVYDIATTAGDNTARQLRKRCVDLRGDAKRQYEEGNAPLLAAQRRARALVEEINAIIEPVETALDKDIKAREAAKAEEKRLREEAERKRISEIRERIASISGAVLLVATADSAAIDAKHSELLDMEITEELFGDFVPEAEGVRARALAELASLYERVLAREKQEAELKRQQEELAAQKAALRAQEDARRAEEAAAAERKQKEIAEQQRQLDEQRAQQAETARLLKLQTDAFEAEKKEASEKIARQQQESDDRVECELKALEEEKPAVAQEPVAIAPPVVEQPVGQVTPELEQAALFVRAARPDDEDIVTCLARNFGASEHDVLEWISTFDITAQANRLRSVA